MTAVLGRLCGHFLRPAAAVDAAAARAHAGTRPAPRAIAVLCPPAVAPGAGALIALAAAQNARTRSAVVCTWTGEAAPQAAGAAAEGAVSQAPGAARAAHAESRAGGSAGEGGAGWALSSARRLAARLGRRGLVARARGRLVCVALPAEPAIARAVAERVAAAVGDEPVVVVVSGARPGELDTLLAAQDRVLVVPPGGDLAPVGALALTDAARVARAVGVLRLPTMGLGRAMVLSGLGLGPAARRAALAALEGDGA